MIKYNQSELRWFPNDKTKTIEVSKIMSVLCAINTDYFFVIFDDLIWGEFAFIANYFCNFFSIFVLKIDIAHTIISILSTSNLLDLGSNFDFYEVVSFLEHV